MVHMRTSCKGTQSLSSSTVPRNPGKEFDVMLSEASWDPDLTAEAAQLKVMIKCVQAEIEAPPQ